MAFEEARDRLKEQLQAIGLRIQESTAYQQLMERFQDLNPNAQKIVLAAGGFVGALLLFLLPWTFFSSSQTSVADFESKKQLIRDLFRTSHHVSTLPPVPPTISSSELRNQVQAILSSERPTVLPDQIVDISDFDNKSAKSPSLPASLQQSGVAVKLSRLNLDQVAKIGAKLQEIRPTAKMVGVRVQSTVADPHYFDVTFKLVAFSLPPEPIAPAKPGVKPPSKPGSGG